MNAHPNWAQKLIHRFLMLRPVTAFFAPRIYRLGRAILNISRGKYTISEVVGWPVIQLMATGAKTNQPRTVPLIGFYNGKKIGLVASNFGRARNPGWYYNLKAHSACEVRYNGQSRSYIAHEAEGEEREEYWQLALLYYAGYETYRSRAAHRHIPIMVLVPTTPSIDRAS